MARNKKYEKNLEKVQSYLDGTHQGKIQSGYTSTEEQHEIGDKWFDSEGIQWEQKNVDSLIFAEPCGLVCVVEEKYWIWHITDAGDSVSNLCYCVM